MNKVFDLDDRIAILVERDTFELVAYLDKKVYTTNRNTKTINDLKQIEAVCERRWNIIVEGNFTKEEQWLFSLEKYYQALDSYFEKCKEII